MAMQQTKSKLPANAENRSVLNGIQPDNPAFIIHHFSVFDNPDFDAAVFLRAYPHIPIGVICDATAELYFYVVIPLAQPV